MNKHTRCILDRRVFAIVIAGLLVFAAVCLPSSRARAEAPDAFVVAPVAAMQDAAAIDGSLAVSPASFSIVSSRSASAEMPIRPRRYPRRHVMTYAPRFRAMLSGSAGYSIPAGDWFDGMTSGFTAGGAVRLAVNDMFYLGFSYDRQWLGIEKSFEQLCFDDGGEYVCYSLDWDIHLDEFYFLLGWMSPTLDDGSPFAYAELGLGAIKHVIETTATGGGRSETVTTDETKFGVLIAVGGVFPLSREIGIDIEGNMRATGQSGDEYDPYYGSYSGASGVLFGFRVGVVAMLGS